MSRLTKSTIEKAIRSGSDQVLWDEDLKGFGCRVSKTGRATWIVKRRLGAGGTQAKQVLSSFGTFAGIDPDKARRKAQELLQDIATGVDLAVRKKQDRLKQFEQYQNGKLQDVWNLWVSRKRDDKGKIKAKGRSYWDGIERLGRVEIIPALGADTPIATITKADLRNLIEKTEKRSKSVARMLYAALSPFLQWCVEKELLLVNPLTDLSSPPPALSRDRVLTDAELALVWQASNLVPYPFGPFYKLLILTAQRREEVASLPWSELDFNRNEWIIPGIRTKNGSEHLVHLTSEAIAVLDSVKALHAGKASNRLIPTYVFTTMAIEREDGSLAEVPICGFSRSKEILDRTITKLNKGKAIPDWRVHDLRRTAATGMASLGVPPHIVERVLNHISAKDVGGLTGIYQRFQHAEERKDALLKWSRYVHSLLEQSLTGGVGAT